VVVVEAERVSEGIRGAHRVDLDVIVMGMACQEGARRASERLQALDTCDRRGFDVRGPRGGPVESPNRLLRVSVNTVAVHRANLMNTLGVHKATGLVLFAVKRGLVVTE
jgi:hypothetical protein